VELAAVNHEGHAADLRVCGNRQQHKQ
jgi:hypothetical protein